MGQLIEVPRVNAYEDHLQVIDIRVVEGQQVEQGDILLVLETTKAAAFITRSSYGPMRRPFAPGTVSAMPPEAR